MAQESLNPNWGEIQDKLEDMLIIFEDLTESYDFQDTLVERAKGEIRRRDISIMYQTLWRMKDVATEIWEEDYEKRNQ